MFSSFKSIKLDFRFSLSSASFTTFSIVDDNEPEHEFMIVWFPTLLGTGGIIDIYS